MNTERPADTTGRTAGNSVIAQILGRHSVSPKRLGPPGPSDEEIRLMIAAAVTAPDHAALRPWRFLLIAPEARERLGELFVEIKRRRSPDEPPALLARERDKALNGPALIAVIARITHGNPKVPESEQYISVGAAVANLLLAASALGYGGILLSGEKVRNPLLREAFDLGADEELVGFVTVGTPSAPQPARPRPDPARHLAVWSGPPASEGG